MGVNDYDVEQRNMDTRGDPLTTPLETCSILFWRKWKSELEVHVPVRPAASECCQTVRVDTPGSTFALICAVDTLLFVTVALIMSPFS